jgi:predicted membrane chloride channel (bestrophin family)
MAYTATYAQSDFLAMIYDLMGTVLSTVVANIGALVTIMIAVILLSAVTKVLKGTFNIFAWLK